MLEFTKFEKPTQSKIIIQSKENDLKTEFSSIVNVPGFGFKRSIFIANFAQEQTATLLLKLFRSRSPSANINGRLSCKLAYIFYGI